VLVVAGLRADTIESASARQTRARSRLTGLSGPGSLRPADTARQE